MNRWLSFFTMWPKTYCHHCKAKRWSTFPRYDSYSECWRAKCKTCFNLLPRIQSGAVHIGAEGIHSKAFYAKNKGSVPDAVMERHMDDKKAPWRKTANLGGRMGFKGNGKQVL